MNDVNKGLKQSGALALTTGFALEVSEGTRAKIVSILSLLTQGIQQGNIRRKWKELAKSTSPEELDVLIRNPHLRNNDFFEAVFDAKNTLQTTREYILTNYSLYRELDGERIHGDYRWIQGIIDNLDTHTDQNAVRHNSDPSIRTILAQSPNLIYPLPFRLMQDESENVRYALAGRKDLEVAVSNVLIIDTSERVRCQAVANSNAKTSEIEGILLNEYPEYNTRPVQIRVLERMDYSLQYYTNIVESIGKEKIPTDLGLLIAISPYSTPELRQRLFAINTKTIKSGISDDIPF